MSEQITFAGVTFTAHTIRQLVRSMTLLAFSLGLLCVEQVNAKSTVTGFEGPSDQLDVSHLKPHLVSNENYVEKYTFNADLKNVEGTEGRLYFSISINNIGAGDHKLHAKGVFELGEERIKWSVKRDADGWRSSKTGFKIKAGGVELSGDPKSALHFKVKTREGLFELDFKPVASPWRPKHGGLTFGNSGEGAYFTLFPLATLSGECSFKNGQSSKVTGLGWGRHTWSHRGPHEWSRWSQLIRVVDPDSTRAMFIRRVKVGGDLEEKIVSYALVFDGVNRVFEGYTTEVNASKTYTDSKHSNRYSFPTEFTLNASSMGGDQQLSLTLKTTKRLYRRNPIAKLSWMKRKVVEMVTKPMEYAYEFDYTLSITGTTPLKLNGNQGRYEIFHLN